MRNGAGGLAVTFFQGNFAQLHQRPLQVGRTLRQKPLQQAGGLPVLAFGAVDGSADEGRLKRCLRQLAQQGLGARRVLFLNAAVDQQLLGGHAHPGVPGTGRALQQAVQLRFKGFAPLRRRGQFQPAQQRGCKPIGQHVAGGVFPQHIHGIGKGCLIALCLKQACNLV